MFKRIHSIFFICCILSSILLLFTSCDAQKTSSSKVKRDTIKIGWIGPLTGDQSPWGQCELNTIKLTFDTINQAGGVLDKSLEIIGYDTKGDSQEAVDAVKNLIEKDQVAAILGPNSSSSAIPISATLERSRVPCIATVATNPSVTMKDGKVKSYNFRVCFIDKYQGSVAAAYCINELRLTKAAILYDSNDEYSVGLTSYFEEYYTNNGGAIVAKESFKTGDIDFFDQLASIKKSDPQLIFMPIFFNEVGMCAKQARAMGIRALFLGGDGWPSESLYDNFSKEIEGSIIVNHINSKDPDVQEFVKAYTARYGNYVEINAYLAHDAVLMLVDAIKRSQSSNSELIAAALEESDVQGITGRIRIGKHTHNPEDKEAAIVKIVDGKEVFQTKYSISR